MMAIDFDGIRREYPLAEVVGRSLTTPIKKAGGNKVTECPFHPDRTPSLVLYQDHYHCFGCGAHGDVIDFVAQHQSLSTGDAIRYLSGGEAPVLDAADRERRERDRRHREEQQRHREENATQAARARWARALPINGVGNRYLERKNVAPYGTRREGDNLLVPIFGPDGLIMSVQAIPPEAGELKLFHGGAPTKGGTFTLGTADTGPVVVVEGFATGATVQAASGYLVVVGFSKGALKRTAEIVAKRHPGREIIIAADVNGVDAAEAAAKAVSGRVIVPEMLGADGTDFNDQAAHYGLEDVAAMFRAPAPALEPPLPLVWYGEIKPILNGNWIIKKLLPADALVTIIGHPGCGKSFFGLDLGAHIGSGRDWQGRKTKKGLVVYLAAEGQRGQQNRVEAWRRHYGVTDVDFAMIPVAVNLRDREVDLPKLIETIRAAVQASGQQLSVLIVDTLNRTFGGGDENGSDMSEYVDNVGRLKAEFGCTTIVVHHIPKNAEGTITERGHGSLRGAIEASLVVSYDQATGVRTVTCTKMKDAEDGWHIDFKLKSVHLGEDEDGEAVTSCVVTSLDENEAAPARGRGPALSPTQRQIFNELLAAMEASAVGVPRDIPDDQINRNRVGKVVSRAVWRTRWMAIGASDMAEDTASRTFRRAVTELQNKGLIGVWNDHAWPTFE